MSLQLESHRPLFNDKDRLNSSLTTKDKQIDRLPRILHPSTKYSSNDSNSLNIRGKSSDGRNASNDDEFSPNEFIDETTSKSKQNPRRRRSSSFKSSNRNEENVRLPIFGSFDFFLRRFPFDFDLTLKVIDRRVSLHLNRTIHKQKAKKLLEHLVFFSMNSK